LSAQSSQPCFVRTKFVRESGAHTPLAGVYCVIRRVRPTNSKIQLFRSTYMGAFSIWWKHRLDQLALPTLFVPLLHNHSLFAPSLRANLVLPLAVNLQQPFRFISSEALRCSSGKIPQAVCAFPIRRSKSLLFGCRVWKY